nr:MAG TPA: hypothetical protein [Caudoviricetes sp.]
MRQKVNKSERTYYIQRLGCVFTDMLDDGIQQRKTYVNVNRH